MTDRKTILKNIRAAISSRWTNRTLLAATAIFVLRYMWKVSDPDTLGSMHINAGWAAAGFALYLAYLLYYSLLWHFLTWKNGYSLPLRQSLAVWMYSIFGKYLPLKILGLAYRIAVYRRKTSAPAAFVTQLCYAEMLSSIIGGSLFSMLLLTFTARDPQMFTGHGFYIQCAATALLVLFFLPPVQKKTFELALRMMGRKLDAFRFNADTALGMVAGYGLGWIFPGISLFCLGRAVYPALALSNLIPIIVLNTMASISGVISLFAPCGIGVREGILLLGLSSMMPGTHAAALVIIARLITSGTEFAGIGASFLYLEKHDIRIGMQSAGQECPESEN